MVNEKNKIYINENDFSDIDDAIQYLMSKKEKMEEDRKSEKIGSALHAVVVHKEHEKYLICTLSLSPQKRLYPLALVENLFGPQYRINNGSVNIRYTIGDVLDAKAPVLEDIKEWLLSHPIYLSRPCLSFDARCIGGPFVNERTFSQIIIGNYLSDGERGAVNDF